MVRTQDITLFDKDGENSAIVDEAGRLYVIVSNKIPEGKTIWKETSLENTPKYGGTDSWDETVPNGETLTLQEFYVGAYVTEKGKNLQWKCELYWQPNGNSTGQELLAAVYLQCQSTFSRFFNRDFVGDGTARFRVEVTNYSEEISEARLELSGYY